MVFVIYCVMGDKDCVVVVEIIIIDVSVCDMGYCIVVCQFQNCFIVGQNVVYCYGKGFEYVFCVKLCENMCYIVMFMIVILCVYVVEFCVVCDFDFKYLVKLCCVGVVF